MVLSVNLIELRNVVCVFLLIIIGNHEVKIHKVE